MSPHLNSRIVGFLAALLFRLLCAGTSPVLGQNEKADAKADQEEFKRLVGEFQKLRAAGKTAEAITTAEAMLKIKRRTPGDEHLIVADTLGLLAGLHTDREEFAAAREARREALAILRKRYGAVHWKAIDARLALEDVERLAKMDRDQRRKRNEAVRLNNQLLQLHQAGKVREAVALARQALAIRKEVVGEHHPDYAQSLGNLAALIESRGDYAAAKPLEEEALAIRKAVQGEHHPDYALNLNNLAFLLTARGDYAAAKPLYEQALALRKAVVGERHPAYAQSLNNLALLLMSQRDYAAAKPLLEEALAIRKEVLRERHPDYAKSLNNLANVLFAQHDFHGAVAKFEQALEVGERHLDLTAAVQAERQQLVMAADLRFHLDFYLSIAPLAKVPNGHVYRHVLTSKGAVLERQRHLGILRRLGRDGTDSETARLFDRLGQTTTRLAALALGTPDPKQADAWREQVAELTREKEDIESKLARKDATFHAAQAEARRRPEDVQASLPRATALIVFLEFSRKSPPGGRTDEDHILAFVVRRDRPIVMIDLGPRAPIAEAVGKWRALLRKPVAALDGPARDLRKLVWEPLESHLEGVATVLVSPDGVLGSVPLAALPGKKAGSYLIEDYTFAFVPVPRTLGTVVERKRNPTPSGLLLVGDVDYGGDPGKYDPRVASRAAAFATDEGRTVAFSPLPATVKEIGSIEGDFQRSFPETKRARLEGRAATEDAFRREATKYRSLHLATHGYFAPATLRSALGPDPVSWLRPGIDPFGGRSISGFHPGLLSGIALAGANRRPAPVGADDGILTALEVASPDLSGCELAVLSACETGLGETAGGEGLLGLQRAFQVAGAHAVVASLWSVGDEPTQALMARFYENLWRKKLLPTAALREAQLDILRNGLSDGTLGAGIGRGVGGLKPDPRVEPDRTPPYFWAAFVLSTDRL